MKGWWCEHLSDDARLYSDAIKEDFKFCPICGTPRPTERTLAEKFRNVIYREDYGLGPSLIKELIAITEEHYKGRGR